MWLYHSHPHEQEKGMDFSQLITLDKQLLLALNGSDSLFFDGLVRTLTATVTWVPLYVALLWLVMKNNDKAWKVLLIVGCAVLCLLLAGTVDDVLVKPGVARWRPGRDGEIGYLVDTVNGYRGGRFGFFSAHASNTFSIAIFFVLLVRSRVLSIALVLWSLTNCWTRLYLGVHYPGDILCGLLWGGFVGALAWLIHRYVRARVMAANKIVVGDSTTDMVFVSTQYTPTGYERSDVNAVLVVLLLTVFYALLRACVFIYV